MKLKAREQTFVGIAAIGGVLLIGYMGPIGNIGIEPLFKSFSEKQAQLAQLVQTVTTNDAQLTTLKQQKITLQGTKIEMPADKVMRKINRQSGETEESTKREILNDIIGIAQKDYGNTLISVVPDTSAPPPAPVPTPVPTPPPAPPTPTTGAPGAPAPGVPAAPAAPEIKLSDLILEVPYILTMRGSYRSINQFLDDLSAYNNIVELNKVEVVPTGEALGVGDPTKPLKVILKITIIVDKS